MTAEEEGGHSKSMFKRGMQDMERKMNKMRRGNNTTHPIRSWMMAKSVDYEEGLQGRQGNAVLMRRGHGKVVVEERVYRQQRRESAHRERKRKRCEIGALSKSTP